MQDAGSPTGALWNDLESERALAFLDEVRVDEILKLLGPADRAEITVHVCVLDRELILKLERAFKLLHRVQNALYGLV